MEFVRHRLLDFHSLSSDLSISHLLPSHIALSLSLLESEIRFRDRDRFSSSRIFPLILSPFICFPFSSHSHSPSPPIAAQLIFENFSYYHHFAIIIKY